MSSEKANTSKNELGVRVESDTDYIKRVRDELKSSKEIIESKLKKDVDFLCWPHGDNNDFVHGMALKLGYRATTVGKVFTSPNDPHRFDRIGLSKSKNSKFLTVWSGWVSEVGSIITSAYLLVRLSHCQLPGYIEIGMLTYQLKSELLHLKLFFYRCV